MDTGMAWAAHAACTDQDKPGGFDLEYVMHRGGVTEEAGMDMDMAWAAHAAYTNQDRLGKSDLEYAM